MANVTLSTETTSTLNNVTSTDIQLIDTIYPPILIVFGVFFNMLIIVIMRTRHFRKQSTSVYMTCGAMNDAASLLISMVFHWLYVNFDGIFNKDKIGGICKFLDFYGWGNCDFGILITTAMTVDRAVAITFPLKQQTSRHAIRNGRIGVAIIAFIVVAKEFHFLIGSDMVDETVKERLCNVYPGTPSYKYFWEIVWPWLHFSFLAVCFITIIASNGILIFCVWKSARIGPRKDSSSHKTNGHGSPVTLDNQWMAITPMLIGESFFLLIFTFPFTVNLVVSAYDPHFYKTVDLRLVFSITFYMLYSNKCITFLVYAVTGSRFRRALLETFVRCFKGRQALRKKRFRDNFMRSLVLARSLNNSDSCSHDSPHTLNSKGHVSHAKQSSAKSKINGYLTNSKATSSNQTLATSIGSITNGANILECSHL